MLLFTSDGVNWSITDLNEVAGSEFVAEQVVLTYETVVVLGRDTLYSGPEADQLPPYWALVATP